MAGIGNLFDSILEPFDDIAAKVGKMVTGKTMTTAPSKLTPPAKKVTGGQKPSGTKPGRK